MISRRFFLRAAPAAAAALPAVVKDLTTKAATSEAMALSGASTTLAELSGVAASYNYLPYAVSQWAKSPMGRAALAMGIEPPEFIAREMRQSVGPSIYSMLEPDVVALKSVSLSAKRQINARRARARMWDDIKEQMLMGDLREAFMKEFGS